MNTVSVHEAIPGVSTGPTLEPQLSRALELLREADRYDATFDRGCFCDREQQIANRYTPGRRPRCRSCIGAARREFLDEMAMAS